MQNNGNSLKKNRRGITGLPVKLLVIMIVLSVSIPIIVNAAENSEKSSMDNEMKQEISKITNAVSVVYYTGIGSERDVEISLPAGCELHIGGENDDAFSIRSVYKGETVSKTFFDKPIIAIDEELVLTGKLTLAIECVGTDVHDSITMKII